MAEKKRAKADRDDDRPARQKHDLSGDPLGKLIEEFRPSKNAAALLTVAIIAGLFAVVAAVVAFVGVDAGERQYVLGASGVLAVVALGCVGLLKLGGSGEAFEVRKKGVRHRTRAGEVYLYWDEIEDIQIKRVIHVQGVKEAAYSLNRRGHTDYEVRIYGSEEIHLTNRFMAKLDRPTDLIKMLKKCSGKDFAMGVVDE